MEKKYLFYYPESEGLHPDGTNIAMQIGSILLDNIDNFEKFNNYIDNICYSLKEHKEFTRPSDFLSMKYRRRSKALSDDQTQI